MVLTYNQPHRCTGFVVVSAKAACVPVDGATYGNTLCHNASWGERQFFNKTLSPEETEVRLGLIKIKTSGRERPGGFFQCCSQHVHLIRRVPRAQIPSMSGVNSIYKQEPQALSAARGSALLVAHKSQRGGMEFRRYTNVPTGVTLCFCAVPRGGGNLLSYKIVPGDISKRYQGVSAKKEIIIPRG